MIIQGIAINEFTQAYLVAGLTLCDEEIGAVSLYQLPQETVVKAQADCHSFEVANHIALDEAYDFGLSGYTRSQAGTDFWLTRNGHGAGFWDRGLGAIGDDLTAACKSFGETELYLGDDKKFIFPLDNWHCWL